MLKHLLVIKGRLEPLIYYSFCCISERGVPPPYDDGYKGEYISRGPSRHDPYGPPARNQYGGPPARDLYGGPPPPER